MASSCTPSPFNTSCTSLGQKMPAQRPGLPRPHHLGRTGSKCQLRRRILNRPTKILHAILLNLPIQDLIVAMHVSKTWLYLACESPDIRHRLFMWHAEHVIDSRPSTPTSHSPQGFELFPKNLRQGVLITFRSPRRGEYFVLMKNHCVRRSLQLVDTQKTQIRLDPLTGRFSVQLYDHSCSLVIDNDFSPHSLSFRCKQPQITGDRLFNYFKTYHSPEDMDWEMLLDSMATRTPLEKAESGEIRLKERKPFLESVTKALRKLNL